MRNIQALLEAREQQLLKVKKEKVRALKKVPEGSLRVCSSGKRVQYYHRLDPKDFNGVYIKEKSIESKNSKIIDREISEIIMRL